MSKIKYITGQRFGRLVALEPSTQRQRGSIVWLCQCDCGNVCFVSNRDLHSTNTKSCGCLLKMLRPRINLFGQCFGRLVVLHYMGKAMWLCRCDCGKQTTVSSLHLRNGRVKSCGCWRTETLLKRITKHGESIKHDSGAKGTPEYRAWMAMRSRCYSQSNSGWQDYGGRGVKVCERWNVYENFLTDMGRKPPGTSLDRIDSDGDYKPSNCRWATPTEQSRNQRHKVFRWPFL